MRRLPTIWLIEDNHADVLLVEEALRVHSVACELLIVNDCEKALRLIASVSDAPALILLDLNLPKGDGHEVLASLRESRLCRATPVIVITSSEWIADRDRVAARGVLEYFCKPSQLDVFLELGAVVKRVLRGSPLLVSVPRGTR